MAIDLENLNNIYLLTYTCGDFSDQLEIWHEEKYMGIIFRVYIQEKTLIVTFSPFNNEKWSEYLRIGFQLVWYQNINKSGMNTFFHDTSLYFAEKVSKKFKSFFRKPDANLVITGMSMGGALGQCFYYHLKPDVQTRIYSFGSPRIGNGDLYNWFKNRKNLYIVNYALFKMVGKYRKVDPVCIFPSQYRGDYSHNYNLTMIFDGTVASSAWQYIDQLDTDISLYGLICNCGFDKETSRLWELIHDTDAYDEAISQL